MWDCAEINIVLRDIEAGEEVLDNYLVHGGETVAGWDEEILALRSMCTGGLHGTVTKYEEAS